MKHPKLSVHPRTILGKKVKQLRRQGIVPANIYGPEMKSLAIQVPLTEFTELYKQVGETGIVDVQLEGKNHPSLIKSVQQNFRTHLPVHVDFFKVNLKEKLKAMIPLQITGEPQAVTDKVGLLMNQLSEVEVEALPEALPDHLEISVANLQAVGDHITVAELTAPEGVTILTEPAQIIASITELPAEEPEETPEAEEATEATGEETEAAPTEEATPPQE